MSYANQTTALGTTAITKACELALIKKAAIRLPVIANNEDQRERRVCITMLSHSGVPFPYVQMVVIQMDLNSVNLSNPTDAQIDASVDGVWPRFVALES